MRYHLPCCHFRVSIGLEAVCLVACFRLNQEKLEITPKTVPLATYKEVKYKVSHLNYFWFSIIGAHWETRPEQTNIPICVKIANAN